MAGDAGSPISTLSFCAEQAIERDDCCGFVRVEFDRLPTACSNTAPAAHKGSVTEQRRFDRELVEPCHVAGRVDAVQEDDGVSHTCDDAVDRDCVSNAYAESMNGD